MPTDLIKILIAHLPRFAEEQGDFYAVSRHSLCDSLCQTADIDFAVAENTVQLCELLLDSLACLRTDYLARDEWCFVSFPAQLMALSILQTMSDKDSRLFEARKNQPHFWNTQGITDEQKEQQRDVLKTIEQRRNHYHQTDNAQPIRFIYVAWSVIKIDNQILFYQREDTKKRHDSQAGDYGLVGGRINQYDLQDFQGDMAARLQSLQSADLTGIQTAIEQGLKRELLEEAGLIYEQHYTFKLWRQLKPYQQVQGAAPNHALTKYFMQTYRIDLSLEGFCFLQQQIADDSRLAWFNIDEMVAGKTVDGKQAYIRALFDDFKQDKTPLKQALLDMTPSFAAHYRCDKERYAIVLPITTQQPILMGNLGKLKPIEAELSTAQLELLLALAAHARGFQFSSIIDAIRLHPYGWIEVLEEATELTQSLLSLMTPSLQTLVIEQQQQRYFRLSVNPEMLFFDDGLFSFTLHEKTLIINRAEIVTSLGKINAIAVKQDISTNIRQGLLAVQTGQGDESHLGNYKKSALHKTALKLGMQAILKSEAKQVALCGTFLTG